MNAVADVAKAAEAVREWVEGQVCSGCLSQVSCKYCHAGTIMHRADDLARAVLEAAGVAGGEEPESRDAMVHDMVMQSLLEEHRRKAALQRAGKG